MITPGVTGGSSIRQPGGHHAISQQQSSALAARIASKKAELDNLKQLRDLSSVLSKQMQILEDKIVTLKDGTEAVACVLSNWNNVLRAISMASSLVKPPRPKEPTMRNSSAIDEEIMQDDSRLPSTLVRIPAENINDND
ncbi:DASH complex subunit DAD2 [Aspergillus sclerotialis]|uniref:DASH complex subunit DAD2 n=1 Tax=Aspergillus sclerotialis TaxID=2070753 RepID=A0A3A2ZR22_9EURO|nr:DASH complex subunit DAD2 [Aspergillus sclerotialis]